MNKFYVLISLFLVAPLLAGEGKTYGGGAGPSGEPTATVVRREAAEKSKECRCPRCGKETSESDKAYCMVQQGKHHVKCGHWVCGTCQDAMQSGAFWTLSKKHSMKCPVCHKEVTGFEDAYGNAYEANAAAGYMGF